MQSISSSEIINRSEDCMDFFTVLIFVSLVSNFRGFFWVTFIDRAMGREFRDDNSLLEVTGCNLKLDYLSLRLNERVRYSMWFMYG